MTADHERAPGNFISQTINQTSTGNLIFSNVNGAGKITAATPGAFKSLQVGQTILINNSAVAQGAPTGTDNNGVYTITGGVARTAIASPWTKTSTPAPELAADNVQIKPGRAQRHRPGDDRLDRGQQRRLYRQMAEQRRPDSGRLQ